MNLYQKILLTNSFFNTHGALYYMPVEELTVLLMEHGHSSVSADRWIRTYGRGITTLYAGQTFHEPPLDLKTLDLTKAMEGLRRVIDEGNKSMGKIALQMSEIASKLKSVGLK